MFRSKIETGREWRTVDVYMIVDLRGYFAGVAGNSSSVLTAAALCSPRGEMRTDGDDDWKPTVTSRSFKFLL